MTIKIVTDSSADIPLELQKKLGISVVPLYVRFGTEMFKDGVTISNDEFYERLVKGDTFPNTSQPSPMDFKQTYEALAGDADGIISIHLSEKFSGTCQSARQARDLMEKKCPVEVINSESMTIGLGMICLAAARAASNGAGMDETINIIKEAIPEIHFLAMFDSLKYLAKGGRIGQAKSLLGTILNIKPMLSMKNGIVIPISMARSFSRGVTNLYNYIASAVKKKDAIKDIAIMYNTTMDAALSLRDRIAPLYPPEKIIMGQIGPILGTHAGPNILVIGIHGTISANY